MYNNDNKINLITGDKCWMEHTALKQLEALGKLDGVTKVVGLPDLHAGKIPVGVALETDKIIYPNLIGGDIGCGMSLFETNCQIRKFKPDRIIIKLNNIRNLEDIPTENPHPEPSPITNLGTIGGGNHFAEYQKVHKIVDKETFDSLGINKNQILMLVHCGSRGYGQKVLSQFCDTNGLSSDSDRALEYMKNHDNALLWAGRNRRLVAEKLMDHIGYSSEIKLLLESNHNYLSRESGRFVHRKGSVSALDGAVIIPGSRGTLTYIVKPTENTDLSLNSLSHGAGRKWARSICKSRIRDKYDKNTIRQSRLGSKTVCHDTELLYQEAPEAYKSITHVIDALVSHKLCTVVATLCPIITFKG